jgi:hypothetical protein
VHPVWKYLIIVATAGAIAIWLAAVALRLGWIDLAPLVRLIVG